jgi:hypothetical protein
MVGQVLRRTGLRRLATLPRNDYSKVRVQAMPGASGRALVVTDGFAPGERALSFVAPLGGEKTMHSLQVGHDLHTQTADHELWIFMNHSCRPNCRLELLALDESGPAPHAHVGVVALAALRAGDVVTFDYNTTEWEMATPFTCDCATQTPCVVAGASKLSAEQRSRWAGGRWRHIDDLLAARGAA